ncbi:DUF4936 family protein [Glaciimonas sp. GG7]
MDLYIYYRVAADDAEQFTEAATAMQAVLSREHQIATALKRRPEIKEGCHTWMEVYLEVPESFAQSVEHAVVDSGVASMINGQRHAEWFMRESTFDSISPFSVAGSPCA